MGLTLLILCGGIQSGGQQSGVLQSVRPNWEAGKQSPVGGCSLGGYSLGGYSRCDRCEMVASTHLSRRHIEDPSTHVLFKECVYIYVHEI